MRKLEALLPGVSGTNGNESGQTQNVRAERETAVNYLSTLPEESQE
jgi:hypothetical protein